MRARAASIGVAGLALLAGCPREHTMFVTANERAHSIAFTGALALIGFMLVGLVMWGLLVWAASRRRGTFDEHAPVELDDGKGWVLVGGIVIPGAVFLVLLVTSLVQLHDQGDVHQMHGMDAPQIRIVGHRWWWEVQYLGDQPDQIAISANEIHIPVGTPIRVEVRSADVIHSFWVPALGGKVDLIPGHINAFTLQADVTGRFFGQCAEFCGAQHANMKIVVVAHERADYDRWLAHERAAATPPATRAASLGKQVFETAPCANCHQIRGTRAHGLMGPDLTHVGERHAIAANVYPNTRAFLAAWAVHAQRLKPDAQMPDLTVMTGEELDALAQYLESLQ
jgi:cytochrome c oxidase subunit 2